MWYKNNHESDRLNNKIAQLISILHWMTYKKIIDGNNWQMYTKINSVLKTLQE